MSPAWLWAGVQHGFVKAKSYLEINNVLGLIPDEAWHLSRLVVHFPPPPFVQLSFIVCLLPFAVYSPSTFQSYFKPCPRHGCGWVGGGGEYNVGPFSPWPRHGSLGLTSLMSCAFSCFLFLFFAQCFPKIQAISSRRRAGFGLLLVCADQLLSYKGFATSFYKAAHGSLVFFCRRQDQAPHFVL